MRWWFVLDFADSMQCHLDCFDGSWILGAEDDLAVHNLFLAISMFATEDDVVGIETEVGAQVSAKCLKI